MKTKYLLSLLLASACFPAALEAQNITVSSAQDRQPAEFLIEEMLGEGVTVFNVQFNGSSGPIASSQLGTFDANGFSQLGIGSGVILATGNVSAAAGPNNSGSFSASSGNYVDNALSSMASAELVNCATLDFDFVSNGNYIYVYYSFGSEEYPEYVCSEFNDIFAFLVTGPDPVTGEVVTRNIATIPGSETTANPGGIPVAINSVNPGSPGTSGGAGSGCLYQYSHFYNHNNHSTGIQYDGYTREMAARGAILPCEVYHMHISICNVGDNSYDSGVFLRGKSLSSLANSSSPEGGQETCWDFGAPGDTVYADRPLTIPFVLDTPDYLNASVQVEFAGQAMNLTHFTCRDENNTLFNHMHSSFTVAPGEEHSVTITVNPATILQPVGLDLILRTEAEATLCSTYSRRESLVDTLHLVLTSANYTPPVGIDPVAGETVRVTKTGQDIVVAAQGLRQVELLSPDGKVVYRRNIDRGTEARIPTRRLPKGVYVVKTVSATGTHAETIVLN